MYKDEYHPQVKHDVKKLPAQLRELIKNEHIPILLAHTEEGEGLVGDLKGVWSYHFSFMSQQYRIAYMLNHSTETVIILMIGKRGEFYQLLKRRIKQK